MIWNSKVVNLSNYNIIFKGYSKETLEVIRSALFDGTKLEPYINRFRSDPYMLWQVKLSLDEGIDGVWFSICPNGKVLCKIRELVAKGINVKPLMEVFKCSSLSESYFDYILKWYEKGVYLGKYNFSILPEDLLPTFDYGISLGYPMYQFNTGIHYSHDYILACLRILSNGKSIKRFLGNDWDLANINLLARYSKSKYYDKLVEYVSKEITPSVLEEMYSCCKVGMPLKEISLVDKDGVYVLSGTQINLAKEAYLKKWEYSSLLKPGMSTSEVIAEYNSLELSMSKRLSGRLRKN